MDEPERIRSWPPIAKALAMGRVDELREMLYKTIVDNKLYSHTREITKKIANETFSIDGVNNVTPLMLACSQNTPEASQIVKMLIDAGADVNKKGGNNNDEIPLVYASVNSTLEVVKLLLDAGSNVNSTTGKGNTALMLASQARNVEIMKLLIQRGANINVKNVDGMTAFITACYTFQGSDSGTRQRQAIKLLIDNGADTFAVDNKFKGAVNYISANNRDFLLRLINQNLDAKEQLATFSEGEIVKGNEGLPTDVIKNIGSFLGLQPAKRAGRKRINKTRKHKSRNVKNTNSRKRYSS
jgi:ankyrin repeat protein